MILNNKNLKKLQYINLFCFLYKKHRDFYLAKQISKHNLTYQQAESISNFCNQIINIKTSKPTDFIKNENEKNDNLIDTYIELKETLIFIKEKIGAKNKDLLYKAVKKFYRKRMFCYQMDTYYTHVIDGFTLYIIKMISFDEFIKNYYFEISLFNGNKKNINIKEIIKISNHILSLFTIKENHNKKLLN